MTTLVDQFSRHHRYLRISLTDRCNLRCVYCMPAEGLKWIPHDDILTKNEIVYLAESFVKLGIEHIRLTGGEPTIRKDLLEIVSSLSRIEGLQDLSMTTNAMTLAKLAAPLKAVGLKRLNISIDSLQSERFSTLTQAEKYKRFLLDAAYDAGFGTINAPIKLNIVVIKGKNDDEIIEFVRYASEHPAVIEPRFIEYMPFGSRLHRNTHSASLREQLAVHTPLTHDAKDNQRTGPANYYTATNYGAGWLYLSH